MNLEFSYSMDLPIQSIKERASEDYKSEDEDNPRNMFLDKEDMFSLDHDPFAEAEVYHKIKSADNEYELSFYKKKT